MLDVFALFSEKERRVMNARVQCFASTNNSYESERVPFEDVLAKSWAIHKENLYHIFGEKMILSKEIEFDEATESVEGRIGDFVYTDTPTGTIVRWFDAQRGKYHWDSAEYHTWLELSKLFWLDNLRENIYRGETVKIADPKREGKFITIANGMGCIKAIGKICEAYDVPHFEEFRLKHSLALNTKTLKGELCLSIHPLDYMTMSDNNCDWESCMSWDNYGCYRRGTVEMMNSPIVIVAYLKSKEDMYLHGIEWSNKKWRTLIVAHPNVIATIKGYPYQSEDLSRIAANWVSELFANAGYDWYDSSKGEMTTYNGWGFCHLSDERSFLQARMTTKAMYNDFSCAKHYIIPGRPLEDSHVYINYSGDTQCVWCGDIFADFGEEENLICFNCGGEGSTYCPYCDCEVDSEDIFEVDGQTCCHNCVDDIAARDPFTGEYRLLEYMRDVRLVTTYEDFNKLPSWRFESCWFNENDIETRVPVIITDNGDQLLITIEEAKKANLLRYFYLYNEQDIENYINYINSCS